MKIVTNKDKELVHEIRTKLEDNGGYCPCALQKNPDTKCMCKDFKDKVLNGYIGECNCGLYKSEPTVVYLCGNQKYQKDFLYWNRQFSYGGNLVLMPPFIKDPKGAESVLRNIHLQKMMVADLIFVIDKYGHVDDDLRKDLDDMKRTYRKTIQYASETDD